MGKKRLTRFSRSKISMFFSATAQDTGLPPKVFTCRKWLSGPLSLKLSYISADTAVADKGEYALVIPSRHRHDIQQHAEVECSTSRRTAEAANDLIDDEQHVMLIAKSRASFPNNRSEVQSSHRP